METPAARPGSNIAPDGGGSPTSLPELAWLFLRLGATSFGGPAAHVAMMENEFVRKRRWLDHAEFIDLLGATNLIPGPNSTEMAMHIGLKRRGWPGFFLAGAGFILPAVVIVLAIAWGYQRFGALPRAEGLLAGVKPVIIAVISQALWGLGKSAIKTRFLLLLAVATAAANLAGAGEIPLLLAAGLAATLALFGRPKFSGPAVAAALAAIPCMLGAAPAVAATVAVGATVAFGLQPLFLFFLKVGSVLYGSGYVLLAFIRADLVERFGWLTEAQLLDAVAVGQVTPGPVFTTATFIGYVIAGPTAALVATIGIFLPAFFFVGVSAPLVPRLRRSRLAGAFLDGVNAASLAFMAVVTLHLGGAVLFDPRAILLAIASAVLLIRHRVNSSWLVLGGALLGAAFL